MDFKCRDAFINVPTSAHFPHGSRLLSILVPFTFPTLGFLTYNSGALSINFLIIIKSYLAFCGKNAYYFLDSISHPSSKWTSPLKIRSISYYESCHQDVGHLGLSVFLTIILKYPILAHKNTLLFVSHCGMTGILEAIYHRVPIVGIANFADQIDNAVRIQDKGLGVSVSKHNLSGDTIYDAIQEVLINDR